MRSPRSHPIFGTWGSSSIVTVLLLLAGCSHTSTQYRTRPFFLPEEEATTHGRKAWYDRIVEVDPGSAEFTVAADYEKAPPKTIAVLPFTDLGDGSFVVDRIPILRRSDQERARWGWSHANHLRRAFAPIDIGINSALNVLELRDITLARAESEVGREIVMRLPVAERNVADFKTEASYKEGSL